MKNQNLKIEGRGIAEKVFDQIREDVSVALNDLKLMDPLDREIARKKITDAVHTELCKMIRSYEFQEEVA